MTDPLLEGAKASQILLAWNAPLRAYKKRGKNVLRFFFAVAFLLSVIVFFFGDQILLIPIGAVLFLFCVLTITPPPIIENRITVFGIETAGVTLRWDILGAFYYTKRFGFDILTIVTHGPYYFHTYMIVPDTEIKAKVTHILMEKLVYQDKPQRTITDRLIDMLSALIPDDEEQPHAVKPTAATTSPFVQTPAATSP